MGTIVAAATTREKIVTAWKDVMPPDGVAECGAGGKKQKRANNSEKALSNYAGNDEFS
jgi:hypothetical protein